MRSDGLTPWSAPSKVIAVGLHKTSTTSLANALFALGYYVGGHWDTAPFDTPEAASEHAVATAGRFGAVQDMPWPSFYRQLDEAYPGSKFVLTVRDPERWIGSVVTHFGDQYIPAHEFFYGVPTAAGHEERYLECFHRHNDEVRAYFADRPDDLLEMDVAAGDGWSALCPFLGLPEPAGPFPRQNQLDARRSTRYRRIAARATRAAARRARVPDAVILRGAVTARVAYPSAHSVCQRGDQLVAALADDRPDEERERLAGMLRAWIDELCDWCGGTQVAIDDDVADALAAWDLARAWEPVRFAVRQWAADLLDEGGGVHTADGAPASDAVRALVNRGIVATDRMAAATGVELVEPIPAVPLVRI